MKSIIESIIGRRSNTNTQALKSGDIVETAEPRNNRYLYLGVEYTSFLEKCLPEEDPNEFMKGILIQIESDRLARPEFAYLSYWAYDGLKAPVDKYDIIKIVRYVDLKKLGVQKMHPEAFKRFLKENLKN